VPDLQTVDPEVSRAKFDREIAAYQAMDDAYRRRGWFLLDAEFPEACVLFGSPKLKPPALLGAVVLDFTDYDLRPPSVRFVDPFTREPLRKKDLILQMPRRPDMPGVTDETVTEMLRKGYPCQNLIQANGDEDQPFLCIPGVREYHENPAHTGDPWLLHRASGEGSLVFILEKIWAYGVHPVAGYQFQIQINAAQIGIGIPPETVAK